MPVFFFFFFNCKKVFSCDERCLRALCSLASTVLVSLEFMTATKRKVTKGSVREFEVSSWGLAGMGHVSLGTQLFSPGSEKPGDLRVPGSPSGWWRVRITFFHFLAPLPQFLVPCLGRNEETPRTFPHPHSLGQGGAGFSVPVTQVTTAQSHVGALRLAHRHPLAGLDRIDPEL